MWDSLKGSNKYRKTNTIMDKLQINISCIINDSEDLNPEAIYQALSEINVTETEDEQLKEVISNLYQFCKERRLSKYYVYLSCMANDHCRLLQKFIEHDKANANLNAICKLEIFEYVVFKRKHWFLKVLKRFESLGKEYFNEIVYQKILLANLIELTNATDIDTEKIEDILNAMFTSDDKFVEFFKTEVKKIVHVTSFIERLSLTTSRINEVFHFIICNSLLSCLSKYVKLQKRDYWSDIESELRDNDAQLYKDAEETTEVDIFLSFIIIYTILSVVISDNKNSFVREDLEKAKENFFKINSTKLQIEVIKILFIVIFLRKEHLKTITGEEKQEYLNDCSSLNGILQFLKDIFEIIKIHNKFNKESAEYKTFMKFNKYLVDAVWRLELISHVKASKLTILPHRLISYMLAPPESLIYMCLKSKDFERAQQVIRIFNLEDSYLAKEIEYSASFTDLKDMYKSKQNHGVALEFLQRDSPINEHTVCVPLCLQKENDCFMNMFDFAITHCIEYEDSEIILNEAFKYCASDGEDDFNYAVFCNKFKQVFEHLGKKNKTSARDVLISSNFKLDVGEYQKDEECFEQLETLYNKFEGDLVTNKSGSLNSSHEAHTTYSNLREICERRHVDVSSTCYLTKLFTYLKAFSKVLYIQVNNSAIIAKDENCSYFEILKHNRALLVGNLLFENNLDPADFEDTFVQLKLDLLYHIAGNCFPTINLHKQEIVSTEELYPENRLYVPTNSIMTYIQKRNWLLAYILSEMYKVHALHVEINRTRIRHFENYMKLARIQHLKVLFDGSDIITALQNEIDSDKLISFIQMRMENTTVNMTSSHSSEDSVESAEEMSEEHMKAIDWKSLFDIVDSIPESQLRKSQDYLNLRDLIIKSMVSELYEFKYHEYVQYICNGQLRIETILGSFDSWPINFCNRVLTAELSRLAKSNFDKKILKTWIEKLELYKLIMDIMDEKSWYEVHKICHENPAEIVKLIIGTKNLYTLRLFLTVFGPTMDNLEEFIDASFLAEFLQLDEPFTKIESILNVLSTAVATDVCYNLLKQLKSIPHLQNVVGYLLKVTDNENDVLNNVQISLKIFSSLSHEELDQFWCLITSPLKILEVLVMNTKLDRLGVALEAIREDLKKHENDDSVISVHDVDEMLRYYAEKSLDFRVVLLPSHHQLAKNGEMKLLESFDSVNAGSEPKKFVMPSKVPSKEEWVSNSEVIMCMCCSETSFSMFNRRHHCRRCGRVVCKNCSQKRMLVQTYGDILVRVCDNCFEQTQQNASSSKAETVSSKSLVSDYWLLTDNEEHNKIVREEFSYEYAPSVSLCLAILKHHSKTNKYPQFLIKQCEGMLKLLHPRTEATHEIDHLLVIRMLKSLALAAKMSCSECMLHWGISLTDKILSQADTLNLLVERGCLGLLPVSKQSEITFIDTSVLRRLRDKLLEDEQWNLALEVSTKTGLENTGVFAAWGKCCLKAGSLQLAREKFLRCFSKTPFDASSDLEASTSTSRIFRTTSGSSGENRLKDPPLLQEIIQILETKTTPINKKVLRKLETSKNLTASTFSLNQSVGFTVPVDPAICILNKLKNLDAIAAGSYYEEDQSEENRLPYKPRIQPIFYEECIFYLQKYGSPLSLLRFFVKHGDFHKAVNCILETKVTPDVFFEIYTMCLKEGVVDDLHTCMREVDPSLDIWKEYVRHVCFVLEKQRKLHSLYQLQLFIGDCIRAALACVYFYKENTRSFLELVHRVHYLQQAEVHLNQNLEQQQWVEVAPVCRSVGSVERFEEKSITNPSLVMKISSKDIGRHINTVWRQIEVTNFLAGCEASGRLTPEFLNQFLFGQEEEDQRNMPTFFDSIEQRSRLVVLVLIGGETVSDGFRLARILIPEFRLKPMKIYCMAGKQLAKSQRYASIAELVTCIRSSSTDEKLVNEMCDEMLLFAVRALTNANAPGSELEKLIKLISDKKEKITAYIEAKQLKSAYFIAVKYKRMTDVRRIMREAELLNQSSIKALCQKFMQSHPHPTTSQ